MHEALERRQPDLTVVLEGVHKPHNFSAIVRSCDAVGVMEAHAVVEGGGLRPQQNVAKGAHRYVTIRHHASSSSAIEELLDRRFTIVAADPSPDAEDFRTVDYTVPTAIVLGEERGGLSNEALEAATARVRIPMEGLVASLNVSVAAALILFEAQQQRRKSGMYDESRVDAQTRRRLLFEWAHPGYARLCRREGIDYPPIDDEGNLLEIPWRTGS